MSLRINHNIAAINGHRNMVKNDMAVSKSLERLSSGLKINRGADDAAGLVISEQMRAQLGGLAQAQANSETAVSMVQTAEGALDEVNTLLSKARQLAIHAANDGVNDTNQLIADQSNLDNIIGSITRISQTTQFGTKKLLDGTLSNGVSNSSAVASVVLGGDYTAGIAAGTYTRGFHSLLITQQATQSSAAFAMANAADTWTAATYDDLSGSAVVQKSFSISINGAKIDVASGSTKAQFIQQLNAVGQTLGFVAIASITGVTAGGWTGTTTLKAVEFGSQFVFNLQYLSGGTGASTATATNTAGQNAAGTLLLYTGSAIGGTASSGAATLALTSSGNGLRLVTDGGTVINLATSFANTGTATSGFIYGAIDGSSAGATFQIGANVNQTATVSLSSTVASNLGIGGSGTYANLSQLMGSSLISGGANEALKVIDKAINDVTNIRGNLGAFQSATLESNISSLMVTSENLTSAESTIRDVDFAAESANFTKNQILVQAATAMMAQANQLPQGVLKLLG